jgi:hypothetical protein
MSAKRRHGQRQQLIYAEQEEKISPAEAVLLPLLPQRKPEEKSKSKLVLEAAFHYTIVSIVCVGAGPILILEALRKRAGSVKS